MSFSNLTFRFYRGLLASLISVGLLVSILVVNGLGQDCAPGSGSANAQCGRVETAAPDQKFHNGSVRPWLLLASRGMRHEGMRYDYGEHEYGERVAPTFSRIVQSARFIPVLALIGLFAIILLVYRLWWYKPLLPVIVVARREIHGVVKSLGTVQSQEPVTVRSQRSGTIEQLHVTQGDKVTKGQILGELSPSTNDVAAAPGDLVRLVAETAGVITSCGLRVGDEVYPGTPILQIVEAEHIRIAARISETRGAQVRTGQAAVIKMGSGREFGGEVTQIRKDPDPVLPQYELLVKFQDIPNPAVIGEEAAVIIDTGQQTAPAIPITAITSRNGHPGVLVVADGLVSFRPISLGVQNGKWAAASDGVKEGELVIITPEATKPGKEVRAEVVPAAFMEEGWI
jgi:multidrug efflux pump subunit AcrA (membrane-fusion protein)